MNNIKHFVGADGAYLGVFVDGAEPPVGAVEVPPRPSANHHWEGGEWVYRAPPYVPSDLSPPQFEYLLALTGFGEVWDGLAAQAKASGDMETFAALTAERRRSRFRLDTVLSVVESFADQVPESVDLSEGAIRAAWKAAENYKGLK